MKSLYQHVLIFLVSVRKKISKFPTVLGSFWFINRYSFFISSGLFLPLSWLVWRVSICLFFKEPVFTLLFGLPLGLANVADILFFCCVPSLILFLWTYKKPKTFFHFFFQKIYYLGKVFSLLARLELLHCEKFLSGFSIFSLAIVGYFSLFNLIPSHYAIWFFYLIRWLVVSYISFRSCFFYRRDVLLRAHFPEFNVVYQELQQGQVTLNRFLFLQLYFLFFLVLVCSNYKSENPTLCSHS